MNTNSKKEIKIMVKKVLTLVCCCATVFSTFAQPYKDSTLSAEARAKDF